MRAEYAILATYRGGDRAGGSHGPVIDSRYVTDYFDDIMSSMYCMESQL